MAGVSARFSDSSTSCLLWRTIFKVIPTASHASFHTGKKKGGRFYSSKRATSYDTAIRQREAARFVQVRTRGSSDRVRRSRALTTDPTTALATRLEGIPARIAVEPARGPSSTLTRKVVTPVVACSGSASTLPRTVSPTELVVLNALRSRKSSHLGHSFGGGFDLDDAFSQ